MQTRAPKLLIGIGNILRGDDGVGVEVVTRLARLSLPVDVEVYEAGTAGAELAAVLEDRELVVVVDAIDAGQPAGAVFRLAPETLQPAARGGLSMHDMHVLHALDETRLLGTAPREVAILAVQVANVALGIGLSPAVDAVVERVVELAARELGIPIDQAQDTSIRAERDSCAPDVLNPPIREVTSCR